MSYETNLGGTLVEVRLYGDKYCVGDVGIRKDE